MNTLENKIQEDLVCAMKKHQECTVSALRSVKTAIQTEKTNGSYHELTDNDIIKIIQKLAKQRQESFEIYNNAGRGELAEIEQKELFVLNNYLPKMLTETELQAIINGIAEEVGAQSKKDMGKVMKELSARYPNQYDGKIASSIIKTKLSNA